MRIVYLHQYFNTPEMAGGTRSYEMGRRLAEAGHEVHIVTTWRSATERRGWFTSEVAGMTVHWLPVPYSNAFSYPQRVRAFLRFAFGASRRAATIPADIVLATSTPLTIAIPGLLTSWWQRIPMVFEVRDLWPDVPIAMGALSNPVARLAARALERIAYAASRRVVVLAPGMRDAVVARGVRGECVDVIPNGCDFDVFGPGADPMPLPPAARGRTVLVQAGTIGIANGVEYVPRLAAAIRSLGAGDLVFFVVVGDGARRRAVEDLAEELDVRGSMVHLTGEVPKHEVARWIAASDATMMTYTGPEIVYRDSVANKFFDSLAAGRAVVANFEGFSTLTARDYGAGFILDRDPERAAAQLLPLLKAPEALRRAGARANALAHERFARNDLASALERSLQAALEG